MKLDVFNKKKEKIGVVDVSDAVFGAPWRPDAVKDILVSYEANARNPHAHTKDRSEVSGGGKKPWRQKHTGRARHGSTRSPIWIGGGVTFGPRNEKDYSKKINKKAKKSALYSILSKKLDDREVFVLDDFAFGEKTKNIASFLDDFFGKKEKKSVLLVRPKDDESVVRAAKNINGVEVISGESINPYACALYKYVVFEKTVAEKIS